MKFFQIVISIVVGMAAGCIPIVGYNMGAEKRLRVSVLHGKMKPKEKEKVMETFAAGGSDVLVSTTVVEVGVDVPNATCMVVENAERFGLSQLHQLRGRVGRGQAKSYCILLSEHPGEETRRRLKVMTRTNNGFEISQEDLHLRGPGDFFGQRQHGLPTLKIADLACDMQLLEEAQSAARALLRRDEDLSRCHGSSREARSLTSRFSGETGTPAARSVSISDRRFSQSSATPLPRMFMTPLWKTPEGSRCRANLPMSLMTVWPALPPP